MGPTETRQVTFAVGTCHPTGEELSVYRPCTSQGPGILCCIDCDRVKAILLLTISHSLNIPDE